MSIILRSPAAAPRPTPEPRISWNGTHSIIWLHGEQDLATVQVLRDVLSAQIAAIDADVIIDFNDVTFVDASTLGALLEGRNGLRERAHSLTLRNPPRCASRLLDVCGLGDLLVAGNQQPRQLQSIKR